MPIEPNVLPKSCVYALVFMMNNDDRATYWSRQPFASFHKGDEISLASYGLPRDPRERVVEAVVVRVVREVALNDGELKDVTWVHLEPKAI